MSCSSASAPTGKAAGAASRSVSASGMTAAAGAMAHCDTPVLFLHGEDDRFVPCAMGRENYACCRAADKTLLTFPAAGHGMSYMADRERYLVAVTDFLGRVLGEEYGTKTTHTFGI